MVLVPSIALRGYKNSTLYAVGLVIRNGQRRDLNANNDILTFTISQTAESAPLIVKTTSFGIEQSDNGEFVVFFARSDLSETVFTNTEYFYLLRIDEGDTGDSYPVQLGPLILLDLP
jgi:hypothetical protein